MNHTILWPTELSKTSQKAVPHVMSLSEKYQSRVIVLYVAPDLCAMFPAYGNYPSADMLEKFQDWELEKAKKELKNICTGELQGCPNLSTRLVRGEPAEQILKIAEEEGADMIVMTSRGHTYDRSEESWSDLGSVAKKVVNNSKVPVYIVYPEEKK